MSKETVPTIVDSLDLITLKTKDAACRLLDRAIKHGGPNESVEGDVVPVFNQEGRESWGVLITVHRHYPDEVLDTLG